MNCFPDPDKHYYMFYKPFGCVTAHRDDLFPVVMDYFSELHNDRLSPVGRLDRETEGLLIVTDDGKWNQYMTNPEFHVPKTYEFAALGTLDARKLQRLAEGVLLTGSNIPTKGADVTVTDTCVLSDILPLLHPDMRRNWLITCLLILLSWGLSLSLKAANVRSAACSKSSAAV